MQPREFVKEEMAKRDKNIEEKLNVMGCVMSLIRTLSDSEDVHKDTWIEQQEELKIRLGEEVAKDMDYIIAGQKYVDDMTDILNLNKEDVT